MLSKNIIVFGKMHFYILQIRAITPVPVFREVFVSDIDENNHLNESEYLRITLDIFYKLFSHCKK